MLYMEILNYLIEFETRFLDHFCVTLSRSEKKIKIYVRILS